MKTHRQPCGEVHLLQNWGLLPAASLNSSSTWGSASQKGILGPRQAFPDSSPPGWHLNGPLVKSVGARTAQLSCPSVPDPQKLRKDRFTVRLLQGWGNLLYSNRSVLQLLRYIWKGKEKFASTRYPIRVACRPSKVCDRAWPQCWAAAFEASLHWRLTREMLNYSVPRKLHKYVACDQ